MGLAGRGAKRQKQAAKSRKRRLMTIPWEEKGLTRAQKVVAFLESLPITKGKLNGQRMKLLPYQLEFVKAVYGKRVRLAIQSAPRGNGKTGLLAGLALCHLLGPECEQRGEAYSCAIDRAQAALMYNEMEAIILRTPEFASVVNLQRFHKKIEVLTGPGEGSIYEALSSDARRGHGLSPSLFVYDELAQAKDRMLLDALMTAMGKRKRSLGIVISTQAPRDDHPLSQLIDDAGHDPTILVRVTSAPMDADPFDLSVIRQCNPALGVFLDEADVIASTEMARRSPAFLPAHRNLRLNQRVDATTESRIITPEVWERGNVPVDLDRLAGRECFGGLDLSAKHDLTAFCLVFPSADGSLDVLPFAWTPLDQLDARRPAERDLFKLWLKQGWLIGVPGPVIRYEYVAVQITKIAQQYKLKRVAFDRWRIDDFKQELVEVGGGDLKLECFGQGFRDMGPAVTMFIEKALCGQLRHGGHPVLTAAVSTAVMISDASGALKPDKEKSTTAATIRIDPLVAMLMAIAMASKVEVDMGKALSDAILARGGFA